MTNNRDDHLDAAALITAAAYHDAEGINVVLDNCDLRAVAAILARWSAGWLTDTVALAARPRDWWLQELRRWCEQSDGDGWPWQLRH